jgi:hypothetical protein
MKIVYVSHGGLNRIVLYVEYFKKLGREIHWITLIPAPKTGIQTYDLGLGGVYSRTLRSEKKYPAAGGCF